MKIRIDDMPVMGMPHSAPPKLQEPKRQARAMQQTPTRHRAPKRPSAGVFALHVAQGWVIGFFGVIAIILVLAHFAPKMMNKSVPAKTIHGGMVGNPCKNHGNVVSAVEISDAGPYPLYNVWCSDGIGPITIGQ